MNVFHEYNIKCFKSVYIFQTAIAINQSPSLREKAILLVKLSQHVEKRFPDDTELNAQFLDLIYYVYRFVENLLQFTVCKLYFESSVLTTAY